MIEAVIFDLDGTLVQTEKLKAESYAQAALLLCPHFLSKAAVVEAYKDLVGLPRREMASRLVKQFNLTYKARKVMKDYGLGTPWQAFVLLRLQIYNKILADPEVIKQIPWQHNLELLRLARANNCKTALATMSHCEQAMHILSVLKLKDEFDFIATVDDVENGKPDPEIYQLVMLELEQIPSHCLVIEDSPAGVKAALAAKTEVLAVSTPFTKKRLHQMKDLDEKQIVDNPDKLIKTVEDIFAKNKAVA